MSYKSHKKSGSRAFDHLYDPIYRGSEHRMRALDFKSLSRTAVIHIIPCYSNMFTDLATKRRNFHLPQRNPLPFQRSLPCHIRQRKAINTNDFIQNSTTRLPDIVFEDKLSLQRNQRSVVCQTTFRESSAQTNLWLPEAKLLCVESALPEVLTFECNADPDMRDVEAIERARVRNLWEKNLPTSNCIQTKLKQLEILEWEKLMIRERELNELQSERMKQVLKLVEDRQNVHKEFCRKVIENVQKSCESNASSKKLKLKASVDRKKRQLLKLLYEDGKTHLGPSIEKARRIFPGMNELKVPLKVPEKLSAFAPTARRLSTPKSLSTRGVLSVNKLKKIYETVRSANSRIQLDEITCRRLKPEKPATDTESFIHEDDELEKLIDIQKTIKGYTTGATLLNGLETAAVPIEKLLGSLEIHHSENSIPSAQEPPLFDCPEIEPIKDYLEEIVQPLAVRIIAEALTDAEIAQNQEILRKAEMERKARREAESREQELKEKRELIKIKIKDVQNYLADESLKGILPAAIELFADKGAREFIELKARDIDEDASKTDSVGNIKEFCTFEVEKRLSSGDEKLSALIAANDAFESAIKDFLEQK